MSSDGFLEFVVDQLEGLGGVRSRSMFGGHGLYRDDVFFAIVARGKLYFHTDETNRDDFVGYEMSPFRPNPGQVLKNYYEVPVDVLEDDRLLCDWARRAVQTQRPDG